MFRLWMSITFVVLAVLAVLSLFVLAQMEHLYDFHLAAHLSAQARALIRLYDPDPDVPGRAPWPELQTLLDARIATLTAAELDAAARKDVSALLPAGMARRLQAGTAVAYRARGVHLFHSHPAGPPVPGDHEAFVVGMPLVRDGRVRGALLLAAPATSVAATVTHFRQVLLGAAAAIVAGVTFLAFFLSRRLSHPLLEMERMARSMAAGDFRQRVRVSGEDEVGRLGESINQLAAALDTTIRKLAEERSRLSGVLSSMGDPVLLVVPGEVTPLNPPAADLLRAAGLDARAGSPAAGWEFLEQIGIGPALRKVLEGSGSAVERVRLGSATYAVRLAPVQDEDGGAPGAVAVWQDVTQEERLEQMRRDFVANVSHEMRTPLSLVRGYVEALQDRLDSSPARREEILGIIRREMDRLDRLVSDLLELARLDSGQLRLETEPVALEPLVLYVIRKLRPLSERVGVTICPEIPPGLPPLLADPDRLDQVMVNLLDNAVRHSPAGGTVTISARVRGDRVAVRVCDRGPGVPPAERALVWERFYRGRTGRRGEAGNAGLGLAIVRGIVSAHGGEVWVEEPPGGGCAFCFTLPVAGSPPGG